MNFTLPNLNPVSASNTVQAHLFRERFEVFLAVIIPFVFMLESGYANAYIFGGGHIGLDFPTLLSLGRGYALEIFIFFCFRMIRSFCVKGAWLLAVPLLLIGMVAMVLSAGLNLGFMSQSPEMASVLRAVTEFMPSFMISIFRLSLGLLFPVGVGLFALYDVEHLITEMLSHSHLSQRAMIVQESEGHRSLFMKKLKAATKKSDAKYGAMADARAQTMVDRVSRGDMSFGANEVTKAADLPATKVTPIGSNLLPPGQPGSGPKLLPQGNALPPLPPLPPKP
jgi:hypothetical protein